MTKILVVDPQRCVRNSIKEILEHEGYAVELAEAFSQTSPPNSLCDTSLMICGTPEKISWGDVDVPWIALSNANNAEDILHYFRAGASDFVAKPVEVGLLLTTVRQVLAHSDEGRMPSNKTSRKKSCQRYQIVGDSPKTLRLKGLIGRVAPTEARV
ncbi:MAG: hypothetical protein J6R10_06310, partial [Tidjanibacter sp.]|nr:hypothetical protein [Tidjanibacter sp.]